MLIPLAGVFQVFDGLQVVAGGILRGLGETRVAMAVNILGYWLLGTASELPARLPGGMGPVGLWWGLVVGLGVVATRAAYPSADRAAGAAARVVIDARSRPQDPDAWSPISSSGARD